MGYFRLFLALVVSAYHLWSEKISAPSAVFGFYTISAFIITLAVNTHYSTLPHGRARFLINRAIRVYPVYWCCLAVAFAMMVSTGFTAHEVYSQLQLPVGAGEWLRQISILGLTTFDGDHYPVRILTTAWSLNVELLYYFIIGLGMAYSRKLSLAWLAVSAAEITYILVYEKGAHFFYPGFFGPGFCFAIGCAACHYRERLSRFCLNHYALILLSGVAVTLFPMIASRLSLAQGLVLAPFLYTYVILSLYKVERKRPPSPFDQLCADITYPFFLLHIPVGAWVQICLLNEYLTEPRYFKLWLLTSAITLLISLVMAFAIDRPLKELRRRIRESASIQR